ncbi:MAG: ankyrin repeat domain-containing protein [Actinobacteria bacterium]|nr:ankyrin repeat domain-containing protein [Actinomycetota bacterium]
MPHQELFKAIETGDLEAVQSIVATDTEALRATNPEGVTPIVYSAYWGQPDIREWLLSVAPSLDFWEAATTGRTNRVQELIRNDPQLLSAFSPDGFTALHLAAFFGHPELVGVLIEAGADVSARTRNALANQPLHAAVAGPSETRLATTAS